MSSSDKKGTNKDDLRRLMESQKRSLNGQNKKIESPLARYNSLGQLSCLVCNCPIKNEVLWSAHILKKTHKDNVLLYKAKLLQKPADSKVSPHPPSQLTTGKRKSLEVDAHQGKQKLLKLSDTFSGTSAAHESSSVSHQPMSGNKNISLPPPVDIKSQHSDDNDSDMEVDSVSSRHMSLPPPAHGSYVSASGESSSNIASSLSLESKVQPLPEGLPEGFMDDPVMDAKVRNVPYRDKMEEQLELFQKEMKQQHMVSEALLEDDDEQREEEREIYEIEEQMHNWSRILNIVEKKNELLKISGIKHDEMEDDDDEDSDDDDDGLDWRAKSVFKK